jgi:hypothetical protein
VLDIVEVLVGTPCTLVLEVNGTGRELGIDEVVLGVLSVLEPALLAERIVFLLILVRAVVEIADSLVIATVSKFCEVFIHHSSPFD